MCKEQGAEGKGSIVCMTKTMKKDSIFFQMKEKSDIQTLIKKKFYEEGYQDFSSLLYLIVQIPHSLRKSFN